MAGVIGTFGTFDIPVPVGHNETAGDCIVVTYAEGYANQNGTPHAIATAYSGTTWDTVSASEVGFHTVASGGGGTSKLTVTVFIGSSVTFLRGAYVIGPN